MACEDIEAMGLQNSDDDEGGIPLTQDGTTITGEPLGIRHHEEQLYFQPPIASLDVTKPLWQLPVTHVDMGPRELKESVFSHPIPYQYQRNCQMIAKHWGCQTIDCVPGDLKIRTPYSLAMLTQMRRLANSTKQDYNSAVKLLLKQWVERVKDFEPPSEQIQESEFVETNLSIRKKACEKTIYENVYGLMICDVDKTIQKLEAQRRAEVRAKLMQKVARNAAIATERAHKNARKAAFAAEYGPDGMQESARQAAVAAVQAEKAKIVTKRRREDKQTTRKFREEQKRARLEAVYHHPEIEHGGVSIAPPNSPVAISHQFAPLAHQHSTRAQPNGPLMEGLPELSPLDKENYKNMANLMDKMGMEYSKPSRKRRLDSLAAGGLSRLAAYGPLPSERLDLSNISPLPAPETAIDYEELARLGQQPLPD